MKGPTTQPQGTPDGISSAQASDKHQPILSTTTGDSSANMPSAKPSGEHKPIVSSPSPQILQAPKVAPTPKDPGISGVEQLPQSKVPNTLDDEGGQPLESKSVTSATPESIQDVISRDLMERCLRAENERRWYRNGFAFMSIAVLISLGAAAYKSKTQTYCDNTAAEKIRTFGQPKWEIEQELIDNCPDNETIKALQGWQNLPTTTATTQRTGILPAPQSITPEPTPTVTTKPLTK